MRSFIARCTAPVWLFLCLFSSESMSAETLIYIGTAVSLDGEKLLYREEHELRTEGQKPISREVRYFDSDGALFATKSNRYQATPTAPDFVLDDSRSDYRESVSAQGNRWTFGFREAGKADQRTVGKPDYTPVIDAGFDEFVRASWPRLMAGKTASFSFAVASRLEWIDFRLIPLQQSGNTLDVEMRLKSRLLSWLLDPVQLTYDLKTQRLLRYRGLTNIRTESGEGIYAEIRYTYPDLSHKESPQ